jgi:hypothetical protein
MVAARLASFVLRPRSGMAVLACTLLILTAVGCNHRRSSLRPVYVTPAPACSTPTLVPETITTSPTTSVVEPGMPEVVEPGASTLGVPAEPAPARSGVPSLSPTTPPASERVPSAVPEPQSGTSPSRSGSGGEPPLLELEPATPRSGNSTRDPSLSPSSSSLTVPRLQPPGTSLNGGRRTTTPARLRRTSFREQLIPFTNNPDDLFAPPKADRPWKYVVLHHSATSSGNYEEIDREHRKRLGWDGCGYHFVIGNGTDSPDGQIEVARRWSEQKHGVHCRNGKTPDVNEYGIGICLVGNIDDQPPTARQVAAAQALVAYLGQRYKIPSDHIGTHSQLADSPTDCPGRQFPVQAILGMKSNLVQR